jgi:hypothetical protein
VAGLKARWAGHRFFLQVQKEYLEKRKMKTDNPKKQAKIEARRKRAQHDLCQHSDDGRAYLTYEASAADERPARICEQCGKQRLVTKVVLPHLTEDDIVCDDSEFDGFKIKTDTGVHSPSLVTGKWLR